MAPTPDPIVTASGDYGQAVRNLDALVAAYQARLEKRTEPANLTSLARTLHQRAKLTASWDDYRNADALFDRAGPSLDRAAFNLSLHRLARVEMDVDRAAVGAIIPAATAARIEGLRGAVALQRGLYADARGHFEAAHEGAPSHATAFQLAVLARQHGDFADADRRLAEILRPLPARSRVTAFYHLQRGLLDLDQGEWEAAAAHYHEADAAFRGWWLVAERQAEILVLQGKAAAAEPIYRRVVAQTRDPALIAAHADCLTALGHDSEATKRRSEASEGFAGRTREYPEAVGGQAIAFYLAWGPSPEALGLARANYALRPGGEAATLLIDALLANGAPEEAAAIADKTLATAYRSAALHAAASRAFEAVSKTGQAAKHRRTALLINPHAFDEED